MNNHEKIQFLKETASPIGLRVIEDLTIPRTEHNWGTLFVAGIKFVGCTFECAVSAKLCEFSNCRFNNNAWFKLCDLKECDFEQHREFEACHLDGLPCGLPETSDSNSA